MIHVAITGNPSELTGRLPEALGSGAGLRWDILNVIRFEAVSVARETLEGALRPVPHWILWTSPRAVRFWNALLLEERIEMPPETKVAVIGSHTKSVAEAEGYEVDFCPTKGGSEGFLDEARSVMESGNLVLVPGAMEGRDLIRTTLGQWNVEVRALPIYRTLDARFTKSPGLNPDLVILTSPSSFESLNRSEPMWLKSVTVATLGEFTASRMKEAGFDSVRVIPDGDLTRLGEIL